MLTTETRRQIVEAATSAACLSAGADFTSGRRHATLTQADRAILGDLGRRLATRSPLVQQCASREGEPATALFAAAFSRAYDARLYDLTTGRQRDAEQLAADVSRALDAVSQGHEQGHRRER